MKKYTVSKKITIVYTHEVDANSKQEAQELAADFGEDTARDGTTDTGWKAKVVKS